MDISGNASGATIDVYAYTFAGDSASPVAGDPGLLIADNFYSSPGSAWNLAITGLTNGIYDVYYYAPDHDLIDTGAFLLNGVYAANLAGMLGGNGTVQNQEWAVLPGIQVTSGMLATFWLGNEAAAFTGLYGLQLVAVPEPSATGLALCGGALLFRRRRMQPASTHQRVGARNFRSCQEPYSARDSWPRGAELCWMVK